MPALAQMSKKSTKGKSGRDTLPEHLVIPDKVFALAEQPACVLEGHKDDVLDLTWSKSDQVSPTAIALLHSSLLQCSARAEKLIASFAFSSAAAVVVDG
jgi:hypothetical protein